MAWDTEWARARVGRVESIAVAARGMGEAGKVEWDAGMLSRADGGGRIAQLVRSDNGGGRPSVVEFVRQRLVEYEVWYRLGLGGIEGGSHRVAAQPIPNCTKNCTVTHRRWPTLTDAKSAFPTLADAHRRQSGACKAGAKHPHFH